MTKKFSLTEFAASLLTPHPVRDWLLILSLAAVLFFSCAAYAGYLFLGIQGGTIIGSIEAEQPVLPKVSRGDLTKTLEMYHTRKANYEAQNFPRPSLVNPSK